MKNEISPAIKSKEKHKEIFYDFLTKFAYLDTLIAFCIASHFKKDRDEKIEITDLLIAENNSQKQFDIFIRILRLKKSTETEIATIEQLYRSTRKLRNLLAHSYLVTENNLKYNGKLIKLTRLSNSKGNGYTEDLQINDYLIKKEQLNNLVEHIYKMTLEYMD